MLDMFSSGRALLADVNIDGVAEGMDWLLPDFKIDVKLWDIHII